MEAGEAESPEVRSTLRDLLALSVLPPLWIGYDPPRLADSLAEVVLSSVSLDVLLLRMHDRAGLIPIEIVRVKGKSVSAEATGRIVNALSSLPVANVLADVKVIPDPLGNGTLRVLTVPIGVEADGSFLVAGSKDPLFPTDENRLILNLTAGHAALVLQCRRAEEAWQQANTRVQLAVRGSNIGIWEVDMPDGQFRKGRVDFTNVWEQLGYARPPSPTDFATSMSLVPSDDSARVVRAFDAYLAGDSDKLEVEHRARRSDGSYRWMLTRGVALRDAQGKAIRLIGSSVDISEHRQAEKALCLSEERFRRYFELGLIGMAITSPSKGCIEVNDETCRILGYSREEMLGRSWAEMTHPDDLAADLAQFERVMAGEIDDYTMDKRWIRKDRRVIDTTISVTAVRREDGSVDYFLALLQDVTERKHAEQALRESEEWSRRLVTLLPVAIYVCNGAGIITYYNERALKIWGWFPRVGDPNQLYCGADTLQWPDGRRLAHDQTPTAITLREGTTFRNQELIMVQPDGRRVNVFVNVDPIRDAQGHIVGAINAFSDITALKKAEADLHVARERLDLAIRSSNIAIWEVELADGYGILTQINLWEQLDWGPGESPTEMASAISRVHADDLPRAQAAIEACLAGQTKECECEHRLMHKDGSYRWMLSRGAAVRNTWGKVVRFVGATMDVTDRKRAQEEVERAREAAERASQIKDEFLATVSHELRAPLAAILLWSQILGDKMLNPGDEAQALHAIRESAHAQQQLIEDLLDVSRMLAGEMRLNLQLIDLVPVVQAAIDIVRPVAETKRIEIDERLDQRAGILRADASRCQQITLNLLNNAVKFTPEGGQIRVRLRRSLEMLEIVISDSGQGISAALLPHIFERFRQADSGTTRRHGGLGLGLAIARQLVELHGGKIRAQSPGEGQGATFTVELPVASGQAASLPVSHPAIPSLAEWRVGPSSPLRGIRALVIEDDATNREVVRYLLERCQIDVTALGSAAEALRAFAASLEGERFDVLVSDIAMPEMNGYELLRAVREMEQRANVRLATPAVALTSYARDQDREAALAAGFNVHLSKPVLAAALIKTIADCVGLTFDDT